MKNCVRIFASILFVVASMSVHAQITNSVQTINLTVTFRSQAPAATNGNVVVEKQTVTVWTTRDFINELGTILNKTFPASARLARGESPAGNVTNIFIQVRSGTNVLSDVSSYFTYTVKASVSSTRDNLVTGVIAGSDLAYGELTFNGGRTPSFDVTGTGAITYIPVRRGRSVFSVDFTPGSELSGTGKDAGGFPSVVTVRLSSGATTTEVAPLAL